MADTDLQKKERGDGIRGLSDRSSWAENRRALQLGTHFLRDISQFVVAIFGRPNVCQVGIVMFPTTSGFPATQSRIWPSGELIVEVPYD